MKFESVIKLISFSLGAATQVFRSFRQPDKVSNSEWGFFKFKNTEDFSFICIKFRVNCSKAEPVI